jgi:histidine triad (HIT) family protein
MPASSRRSRQHRQVDPRPPAPCVFDRIARGEEPARLVLDEEDLLGFLDTRPLFPGHTLVVPRLHVATVADLPDDLASALFAAGRRVAVAQRVALGCAGTFFAVNDVVSQSVPHVHLHVVPRTRGDGLRGFFWPRNRYDDDAHADAVAAGLRAALPPPGSPPPDRA